MNQKKDYAKIIVSTIEKMMDLVEKLRTDSVNFEEALQDLGTERTDYAEEWGFNAGREYSSNLLVELAFDVEDELTKLVDEVIPAKERLEGLKLKLFL